MLCYLGGAENSRNPYSVNSRKSILVENKTPSQRQINISRSDLESNSRLMQYTKSFLYYQAVLHTLES